MRAHHRATEVFKLLRANVSLLRANVSLLRATVSLLLTTPAVLPTKVALLLTTVATSPAATRHVPTQYALIRDAVSAAAPGDTIRVEAGTYAPSTNGESYPLLLFKAVHLIGAGWDVTTLDAEGTSFVVDVPAAPGGHISGFTLTGGWYWEGAGVRILAGSPEIERCLLLGNSAFRHGSGIYVTGGAAPWIHHNVVWQSGDWDPNDTADPHGIDLRGGAGVIEHNLVGRGVSNGIFIQSGSAPAVRNNILFENGTPLVRGRGICHFGDPATIVAYNLFHGNAIAALVVPANPFMDVTASQANDLDPDDGIHDNLDGDPLFVDADGLDWNLQPESPAVDAGDPNAPVDPDGTRADIGPFYFDQSPSSTPDPGPARRRLTVAPNPFRSSTVISIRPLDRGPAEVLVLDVSGRLVRRLPVGTGQTSPPAVTWDGRDEEGKIVEPGVYFVKIRGDATGTRVIRLP